MGYVPELHAAAGVVVEMMCVEGCCDIVVLGVVGEHRARRGGRPAPDTTAGSGDGGSGVAAQCATYKRPYYTRHVSISHQ
jgi:hypothetical protein